METTGQTLKKPRLIQPYELYLYLSIFLQWDTEQLHGNHMVPALSFQEVMWLHSSHIHVNTEWGMCEVTWLPGNREQGVRSSCSQSPYKPRRVMWLHSSRIHGNTEWRMYEVTAKELKYLIQTYLRLTLGKCFILFHLRQWSQLSSKTQAPN